MWRGERGKSAARDIWEACAKPRRETGPWRAKRLQRQVRDCVTIDDSILSVPQCLRRRRLRRACGWTAFPASPLRLERQHRTDTLLLRPGEPPILRQHPGHGWGSAQTGPTSRSISVPMPHLSLSPPRPSPAADLLSDISRSHLPTCLIQPRFYAIYSI